jgi:translation initiation factor IF-3
MDYGKFMYAQQKKERLARAHRHEAGMKGIRIKTPKIDPHDLSIKVNRARGFLERGDRVQFTLRFRGRELAHIDEGRRVFESIKSQLEDISKVDQNYRFEGRRLTMALAPLPRKATPRAPGTGNAQPAAEA